MCNNFTQLFKRTNKVYQATSLFVMMMVLVVCRQAAVASGKPVGRHRLFLIPNAAYFFNNTYWDQRGVYRGYANGVNFSSTIISISSEYGFSRRLSLMASIPFIVNRATNGTYSQSVVGLGDMQLGLRYYLANINYNTYFSVQGLMILPLYSSDPTARLGFDKIGADIRAIGAGDFSLFSQKFYWEINTGILQYLGTGGPFQIKNSLSLSYAIDRKNQISLAATSLYSISGTKDTLNVSNPIDVSNNKDFSFNQLTASYSYSIKRNKSLFFSFSRFVTGRNTGAGTTISVGYVYKY